MRQQIKDLIFKSYHVGHRFKNMLCDHQREHIVVLCYHRVSDDLRDHVTVGIDQFAEQIAFLKANYTLVSLREITHDRPSEASGPLVSITFDDGYLDNYQHAFPILTKEGVSATFFISTDHITEQKPFAHDLEKLGYGLPNMSWDHIREMHRAGMDFGSHTANHVDLGQVDEADAWQELTRSDAAVRTELGIDDNLFAFPFGRPTNMSAGNHALVRKAGYRCCCSAYGGLNERSRFDPFDIKRIGVNYGFSLPAIAAYVDGWHRRQRG